MEAPRPHDSASPPPVPPARKKPMPAWAIVLLVFGGFGLLAVIAGLVGAVALVVPQMREKQIRIRCEENLSQLGGLYVSELVERRDSKPPRAGTALFLEWRKSGRHILPGQESVLICPGDPGASVPDTAEARARYDSVDLDDPPGDLCSYAVRDLERFPLEGDAETPPVLAACAGDLGTWRHRNGTTVLFEDGSVRFLSREELGLGPDEPLTIGPDSSSPILRVLRGAAAR